MKPIKQLSNVFSIEYFSKDHLLVFNNENKCTLLRKQDFSYEYDSVYFYDWAEVDDIFYSVQTKENGLWTLIYKKGASYFNENLQFKKIEVFNDEFFIITNPEGYKTLIYKKDGTFFTPNIWATSWFDFDEDFFEVCIDHSSQHILINKKTKKSLSDETYCKHIKFNDNLIIVKLCSNEYSFLRRDTGKLLNEGLTFEDRSVYDTNEDLCCVKWTSESYYFIDKKTGEVNKNLPVIADIKEFEENEEDFYIITFRTDSYIDTALLRKSDGYISPLYYDIKPFNKKYVLIYLDDKYTCSLMKKSDFTLLCNYLSFKASDIECYPESEYFTILKNAKLYLYK